MTDFDRIRNLIIEYETEDKYTKEELINEITQVCFARDSKRINIFKKVRKCLDKFENILTRSNPNEKLTHEESEWLDVCDVELAQNLCNEVADIEKIAKMILMIVEADKNGFDLQFTRLWSGIKRIV